MKSSPRAQASRPRKARVHRAALVLFLALLAPLALVAQAPLVLEGLGQATAPIGGSWQFHTGDDPAWSSPAFNDSSWSRIETGHPWEGQGHRDLTGFAWYRRHITLPADYSPGWNLALSLSGVQDAAEVYWNGHLIGAFGKVPPKPVWYGYWYSFPSVISIGPASAQPREAVLAIRVWKAPFAYLSTPDMGGLTVTPLAGSVDALAAMRTASLYAWLRAHLYDLGITLLSTMVSLLALLTWLRDRRQWMLFWLALYTIRPAALMVSEGIPWLSWRAGYGSVGTIYSATDAALWFLLLYLLGLKDNRTLLRWTCICAAVVVGLQVLEGAEQLFDWTRAPRFFLLADVGLTIPSLLLQIWGIVLIVAAFRKRLETAYWMLAITGLFADVISNSVSWLDLGNRWTHWTIAPDTVQAPLFTVGGNPFNALTIASTLLLVSIVYAAWHYEKERSRIQTRLSQEFRNAQELQQVLIPEDLPALPGISITTAYRPAQEVGGDFFQLVPLPNGALLVLGDVSGKGLHAAMTVALLVGAIRSTVENTSDPAVVLSALNRRLHGRLRHGFATCLVLRVDRDGSCVAANAGHLPPYLNGSELQLPAALPLGLLPEADYESFRFQLAPGQRLTVYTDGLLEARNPAGELFGFERIAAMLAESPDASAIADAAQRFGQDDDITVLTLALAPVPAPAI